MKAVLLEFSVLRENSLIQWIQGRPQAAVAAHSRIVCGIGDDAAWLRLDRDQVVTTDLIAEGSHFTLAECTPAQVGRKAMAVNLSDMAAMACSPVAAFASLLLPATFTESMAQELMTGMLELANEFDCVVAGGDTNVWPGKLAVSVTVLGCPGERGPLRRDGGRPGDILLVTGTLGGSRQGHHLLFQPRIREALQLHESYQLHAGMDLSDGVATDLRRMCRASGCGAEIFAEQLPIASHVHQSASSPEQAQLQAIGDGEDFELLLAVPPEEADRITSAQPLGVPITAIGQLQQGDQLWLRQHGQRRPLPEIGYEHRTLAE